MARLYRSGWEPGVYYMLEIWWKRMMFPPRSRSEKSAPAVFTWNCMLVTAFTLGWLTALSAVAVS